MSRIWIAISIMTLGVVFTVFIAVAASYAMNERCTEQMAWNGNC